MSLIKKIEELRNANTELINANNELVMLAEGEERNLSEDEVKDFDGNLSKIEANNKQIARFNEQVELEKSVARSSVRNEAKNTPKEVKEFSFAGFIKDIYQNGRPTGLNAEMHQEAVNEARKNGTSIQNFGIPEVVLRDSTAGTDTQGGHTVETTISNSFIESLVNKTVMRDAGAQFLTGLNGDLKIPRIDTPPSATWEGETDLAAETDVVWGQVTLAPKRLGGYVQVSKQLMLQSNYNVDQIVRNELIAEFVRAIDEAAIITGAGASPTGILGVSGTTDVAMGTNGAAISYTKLVEFITAQEAANGTDRNLAFLTNSKVLGDLMTTTKDSGSGRFLYNDAVPSAPLMGKRLLTTNAVPSNLTKGTGSNLSAMIYGDFNEVLIGMWGGIDVLIDPYSSGKSGLIDIVCDAFADVQIRHAASFAVSEDIVTTL